MNTESILKKLISFKTISKNHKQNKACIAWILRVIKNNKISVHAKIINKNSFPSLIITTQKTKTPKLWLAAHLDVVHASDRGFKARKINNRLYGRGASDMKFAAATYIKLLLDFKNQLSDYDFGIMFTTDEELGGINGTKYILGRGYRSKVVFLPDGGRDWQIEMGAKGAWHLSILSKGKSAHGSRTWMGENAIEKLINFLQEFKGEFIKEPCHDPKHWHPTLNIGTIEGGRAINQIPDSAAAHLDIRFCSLQQKVKIEKKLNLLKKKYKGIQIETEMLGPNFKIEPNNRYLKIFMNSALKTCNIKTGELLSHGSSDARYFAQKNIPVIATRPKMDGHHSENEWIDLKDLSHFYLVLKDFVKIAKTK